VGEVCGERGAGGIGKVVTCGYDNCCIAWFFSFFFPFLLCLVKFDFLLRSFSLLSRPCGGGAGSIVSELILRVDVSMDMEFDIPMMGIVIGGT